MTALSSFADTMLSQDVIAHQRQIGVLQVSGVDGKKFLQGQITCDMNKLTPSHSLYGAVCSIKGRIIANFLVIQQDEQILLLMSKDLLEKTLTHLKKYAVFFKVELADASEAYCVTSIQTQATSAQPTQLTETLPTQADNNIIRLTLSEYPVRTDWLLEPAQNASLEEQNHQYADVLNLLIARPMIRAEHSEDILPQWLNMQRTGGISFTKGCYTGQEIVARMQYRGKSKKQLALFRWQGGPTSASNLTDLDDKTVGQVFAQANAEDWSVAQVILNIEPEELSAPKLGDTSVEPLALPYTLDKR